MHQGYNAIALAAGSSESTLHHKVVQMEAMKRAMSPRVGVGGRFWQESSLVLLVFFISYDDDD